LSISFYLVKPGLKKQYSPRAVDNAMKTVNIKPGGILPPSEKTYFGGPFSFWEKLRMKGIGSPKMVYESGIAVFDEEDTGVGGEVSFVSMEVLKNGLIIRLNRNNRHRCAGIRLTDIENIRLTAIGIQRLLKRKQDNETKIVYRGELEIRDIHQQIFRFQVMVAEFQLVLDFFYKPPFGHLFEYEVSEAIPEKESIRNWT
jgi:hypothetical protein